MWNQLVYGRHSCLGTRLPVSFFHHEQIWNFIPSPRSTFAYDSNCGRIYHSRI